MSEHTKEPARVAAGLKAAIRNPNVSLEAKESATQRLKEMEQDAEPPEEPEPVTQESTRVLAGYKATLTNPYTSAEAKAHAEEVLQAAGIREREPGHSDEEHQMRVLAGYKASLHNPRVSEEAKQHARDYLGEYGIEA
jgi:hypothetical protein